MHYPVRFRALHCCLECLCRTYSVSHRRRGIRASHQIHRSHIVRSTDALDRQVDDSDDSNLRYAISFDCASSNGVQATVQARRTCSSHRTGANSLLQKALVGYAVRRTTKQLLQTSTGQGFALQIDGSCPYGLRLLHQWHKKSARRSTPK